MFPWDIWMNFLVFLTKLLLDAWTMVTSLDSTILKMDMADERNG